MQTRRDDETTRRDGTYSPTLRAHMPTLRNGAATLHDVPHDDAVLGGGTTLRDKINSTTWRDGVQTRRDEIQSPTLRGRGPALHDGTLGDTSTTRDETSRRDEHSAAGMYARQRKHERELFANMPVTAVEARATLTECVTAVTRDIFEHLARLDAHMAQQLRHVLKSDAAWRTDNRLAGTLDAEAEDKPILRASVNKMAAMLAARPEGAQTHSVIAAAAIEEERKYTFVHIQRALAEEDKTASIIERQEAIRTRIINGLGVKNTHSYVCELLRLTDTLKVLHDPMDPSQVVASFVLHCPDQAAMQHAKQRVGSLHARTMIEAREKLQELHRAMVDHATDKANLARVVAQGNPPKPALVRAQGYPVMAPEPARTAARPAAHTTSYHR